MLTLSLRARGAWCSTCRPGTPGANACGGISACCTAAPIIVSLNGRMSRDALRTGATNQSSEASSLVDNAVIGSKRVELLYSERALLVTSHDSVIGRCPEH